MRSIAIQIFDKKVHEQAQQISAHLELPVLDLEHDNIKSIQRNYDFLLCFIEQQWLLRQTKEHIKAHGLWGDFQLDFVQGALKHRLLYGGGKGQMIAKAVGIAQKKDLKVLDCTAGLAKDAFVLASLGCHVDLCEQNTLIYFLLAQALVYARQHADIDPAIVDVLAQMQAHNIDAATLLTQNSHAEHDSQEKSGWDVVYLDPMFPERRKSAKVKKDMQFLQALLEHNNEAQVQADAQLLDAALNSGCYRVVVKRPAQAPSLAGVKPSYELKGKSTRFDIYALKSLKN